MKDIKVKIKPRKKLNTQIAQLVLASRYFDIETIGGWSYSTLYYALIIHYHPAVIADINRSRTELDYEVVTYQRKNLESLYNLEFSLPADKRRKLNELVETILVKFSLGDNWNISIKAKILTDILVVPYETDKFQFHYPITEEATRKKYNNIFKAIASPQISDYLNRKKFPAIHITEKIDSKNELITWIHKNWEVVIRPSITDLPSRLWKKADLEQLMLGLWLRNLRQTNSLNDVDKIITAYENQDENFFGTDDNRITLDKTKCSDLINRATNTLREFYPI